MKPIRLSNLIREKIPNISFGCIQAIDTQVINDDPAFPKELIALQEEIRKKFSEIAPSQNPIISATRRMYRSAGWEPTKYRPSSEALVRRILNQKDLYRINNFVDYGNLVSARYHIPMGLYDLDKIKGEIILNIGGENEYYQGLSKSKISATGKLILRDDLGIFGNPTADSLRTSIQNNTKNVYAVFFIGGGIEHLYVQEMMDELVKFYRLYTAKVIETALFSF